MFKFVLKLVIKIKKNNKSSNRENTLKLNKIALKSTEKAILKAINTGENLQEISSKKLKSTFSFTSKKQNNFFNNLEQGKEMIWKNLNKTLSFF
jgi:hypothetical protein